MPVYFDGFLNCNICTRLLLTLPTYLYYCSMSSASALKRSYLTESLNQGQGIFMKSKVWLYSRLKYSSELLRIKLKDINRTSHGKYFVGDRKRLATATAVKFVNSNRLVAANTVGMYLVLVEFDLKKRHYNIIQEQDTLFESKHTIVDLLDYDGRGNLLSSNCDKQSASIYQLDGTSLRYSSDVKVDKEIGGFTHSAKYLPWNTDIVCLAKTTNSPGLIFVERSSGQVRYILDHAPWLPKDVCFPRENEMIIISSAVPARKDLNDDRFGSRYISKLTWISLDPKLRRHQVLTETLVDNCHVDGCHFYRGMLVFPNQHLDKVHVYRAKNSKITPYFDINGYSFPHGIDVESSARLLAVTNYGDNTISIRKFK